MADSLTCIECYECADCTIPFSSYFANKINCDSSSCMKMNITTKFNKMAIVSRGCSTVGFQAERCEYIHVSGTTSEICYCNDDECNKADSTKMTLTILFAFFSSSLLL
ncbi:uncharacterized protein LOC132712733 isoform X2 [Ruditapes philippinarum]|uniref:uncharacterized protein LOC132712733 isoform X2 n=1 Tax=Ruditapes philippinarum TaxID=129788 RepID=UPI00295BD833|nr:uncharacterized protein LOC132712733 isoform X2 [Ruditapes philippinarum]